MKKSRLAFALLCATLTPSLASAQELSDRKSPLADAPAIRHRVELRAQRFELGAGLGSSLAAGFQNAIFVNLRLAYHLNDWLAISATGGYNLTPDYKTGVTDRLVDTLKDPAPQDRAPTAESALGTMNKMNQIYGLQAELSPITGKFSLFGKWFAHYDMYALAGLGVVNFGADSPECTGAPVKNQGCPDVGMRFGGNVGLGVHAYLNRFLALNFEVKNLLLRTNRNGRDVNADGFVNDDDIKLTQNYIFAMNLNVFFPTVPKISD
jgi:outer membrane beta-barrel protein